jgi:hypothetical protein
VNVTATLAEEFLEGKLILIHTSLQRGDWSALFIAQPFFTASMKPLKRFSTMLPPENTSLKRGVNEKAHA